MIKEIMERRNEKKDKEAEKKKFAMVVAPHVYRLTNKKPKPKLEMADVGR